MQHTYLRLATVIALALPLGACQSFLGLHLFARHSQKPMPEASVAPAALASATEAGRKHLDEGRTGSAIEEYQRALATGEPVAPAVNGMGVAYARLGRYDLAKRYFEQAAATDPANLKYADNLTLLIRSPVFAMRHEGDMTAEVLRDAQVAPVETAVRDAVNDRSKVRILIPVVAQSVQGRLQRVSRNEFRISTVPAQAAPLRAPRNARNANVKPSARISVADPMTITGFKPLVRVELPEAKPALSSSSRTGRTIVNIRGNQ